MPVQVGKPAQDLAPRGRRARRPCSPAVQILLALGAFFLISASYLALMRLSVDRAHVGPGEPANDRDLMYLALHLAVLVVAVAGGFALGKMVSGLGFAYAALFAATVVTMMAFAQVGSYALACDGHNDLIRHWEC